MAALQRRSGVIRLFLFMACLAGLQSPAWAQTNLPAPRFLQELRPELPDEIDPSVPPTAHFGHSISVFDDTALIGMPAFENVGRVAVFRREASGLWRRQGSIESPDGLSGGNFGFRVTLLRDVAFVAFGDGNVAGTHIFRRTKDGFDLARSTSLAFLVDRPTGLLFSGAPASDGSVIMTVFRLDGRQRLHRVRSFVIAADMRSASLGQSAVWDDTFVVTNPSDNGSQGAAYLFERRQGAWRFTRKLIAADGTGAVYTFERRHHLWSEDQKIARPPDRCNTNFGLSLAFNGELLLVTNADSATFSGDAGWHVFERQFGQYQPIAFRFSIDSGLRPGATSFDLQGEALFFGVASVQNDESGSVTLWDLRPDS
jgi:hypothetical protein